MPNDNDGMNRRSFLKGLVLVTTAAATGGGAGVLLKRREAETVIEAVQPAMASVPSLPPAGGVVNNAAGVANNSDLMARLAAAQAENMRLQSELTAAQNRLASLEAANGDSGRINEALQAELAAANDRAGLLAGLVTLYEQLDQVDVGDVVANGVSAMGQALADLTGQVPSLEEGLTLGSAALDEFEGQIPLVVAGRNWVESHLARLELVYLVAQEVLSSVLETAGDFLQLLADWFANVMKWVPFGMGEKTAQIVTSLTDLMQETPNTIAGLRSNVAQPLDLWLAGEGEEVALRQKLVKPLREQTIATAGQFAGRVFETQTTYNSQLAEPVQEVAARRQAMRQLIGEYRQKHQV